MRILFTILFTTFFVQLYAQELNCRVVLNAQQIQTTERNIFTEMETSFAQFLNDRKWTDDEFKLEERINCNLIITLDPNESDPTTGRYGASVQILSSRPVYGADYETVLFNFADRDWQFEYLPSQPMIFNENSFTDNLTSILAYYAYVIIGYDYDSFEELGGTRFFQIASQIVNNAQNSNYSGWQQFNSVRNRYWLTENLLSTTFEPVRKGFYNYHLSGLDVFLEKPDEARQNLLTWLVDFQTANKTRPRSIYSIALLEAKSNELTQVFKEAQPIDKRKAFQVLIDLDPSRTEQFKTIIQ
ncbi:MAG: DUF4835 family protein [Cyclobacteriaceae bacterium]